MFRCRSTRNVQQGGWLLQETSVTGTLSCTWGRVHVALPLDHLPTPFGLMSLPPPRCYFLFLPWKVSQLVLTWIPPPAPDSPALIECLRDNLHFSSPPGAPSEAAADVSYTA